jgi:hypothetical protein
MHTECVAFEITETGAERPLDAYETACVLSDIRRWDDAPESGRRSSSLFSKSQAGGGLSTERTKTGETQPCRTPSKLFTPPSS